jgi:hypothetical protein
VDPAIGRGGAPVFEEARATVRVGGRRVGVVPNDSGQEDDALGWLVDDRECSVPVHGEFAAYRSPDLGLWAVGGVVRDPLPASAAVELAQGRRLWTPARDGAYWMASLSGVSAAEPLWVRYLDANDRVSDEIDFRLPDLVGAPRSTLY